MILYERFGSNVEAHLIYAADQPLEEWVQILTRRLEDGSWTPARAAWTDGLTLLVQRSEARGGAG
ncbi:hypothetical protein WME75_11595 [Sorangium sp. So ce1014]|uniref:hypothetical protein n=1 Tax=Sorangium sp. So ce1014 TaxID=3133326 RepID=UPI003F5E8AEF